MGIKNKIWFWFLEDIVKHPEATIMPTWLKAVYSVFYPLKALRYITQNEEGYQYQSNTWLIYGQRYSDEMFRHFAFGGSETFKIVRREDGVVTIKKLNNS